MPLTSILDELSIVSLAALKAKMPPTTPDRALQVNWQDWLKETVSKFGKRCAIISQGEPDNVLFIGVSRVTIHLFETEKTVRQ